MSDDGIAIIRATALADETCSIKRDATKISEEEENRNLNNEDQILKYHTATNIEEVFLIENMSLVEEVFKSLNFK